MRWLPSISFSSSSFRSSSRGRTGGGDSSERKSVEENLRDGRQFGSRIRLTRQRKLRHLRDQDVAGIFKLSDSNLVDSPWRLRHCSSGYDQLPARSSSASAPSSANPQPLPLPESSPVHRRKGEVAGSSSGDGNRPLPSPKARSSRGLEDRDRDRADGASDGFRANSPIRSPSPGLEARKTTNQAEMRSPLKGRRNHNHFNNFTVELPIRSAPTSPYSSPALSPQRPSNGDVFPYYYPYMVPYGNQVWSAPEMPSTDMMTGFSPQAYLDYPTFSNDCSPLNSPPGKNVSQIARSTTGPSSPLPARKSFETTAARREGSAPPEVHPLPLPPVAAMLSPSSSPSPSPSPAPSSSFSIPQSSAKSEPQLMKCQWQKGKLIGRGTFGSVYVASNRETGALCAMKEVELFPDDPKSAECIKQLQQEIKVLSKLRHPNIVQYYGSEIVHDRFYIYLEYVHPGSINKYAQEHCGAITESVVRNFTRHILSGLAYLHSTKTIHRDIKGANLLVDSCGVVKLADFGMAKILTGQAAVLSLKGSPYWMAPELMQAVMQKDNNSDLALAVDIWSLGCTIIEMLTGKPPWSEYEGAAAMFKVMKDTPPIPDSLSSEGKDFLRCCFRRNPAERSTAAMLLEHRFLKNSQQMDVPSCRKAFNGMNLTVKPHSATERSESTLGQRPISLSSPFNGGKIAMESETGQQSRHETSDLMAASSRHSPRSTLESHSTLSPPRCSARKTHQPSSRGARESHTFR
ncbi:hypothetical protein UlMin_039323 [Ulmus minor]